MPVFVVAVVFYLILGMNMSTILSKSIDYQTTKNLLQSLCDNKEQK